MDGLIKNKYAKSKFIAGIILLIFLSPIFSNMLSSMFPNGDSAGPIYNVAIAADTQKNIWSLCQESNLSYELLLSIYHADGIHNRVIQDVEKDIADLIYLRNYWDSKGYADEDVFDLMIISRDISIEGCKAYVKENPYYRDNEYLKRVTAYKYYLEQNLDFDQSAK